MKKSELVNIILADDHAGVRQAYAIALVQDPKLKVIAHANNGSELLQILKHQLPDIVLLDLEMPVMNGYEALKIIKVQFPKVKCIVLSMHYSDSLVNCLLEMGAASYLTKAADPEEIMFTIHKVYNEGFYFKRSVPVNTIFTSFKTSEMESHITQLALNPKEIKVLILLCEGKTNKEAGKLLNISPDTVDFHRRKIYKKTNSKSISCLVKYAIKNQLIEIN